MDNYTIGMNYYEQQNFQEAKKYFENSLDDPRSAFALAVLYYNGEGIDKNYTKSSYYYEIAANAGIVPAMVSIGFAYANSIGVAQNFEKAVFYLKKAVDKKELAAMVTLGEIYAKGIGFGSRIEAAKLIKEVLDNGYSEEASDIWSRYELWKVKY